MNNENKTREELLKDLIETRREIEVLKVQCEKNVLKNELTEKALHTNHVFLNEIGKMANVGGWELNVESGIVKWTNEVYRIHEVELDFDPSLNQAIEFYTEDSKPVIELAIQRAIESGEPYDLELEIITAKGNTKWVHAIGKPNYVNDNLSSISGTFQDITERKRIEKELAHEKFLFNALMDHLPDSIYFKDLKSRFIRINKASSRSNRFADPGDAIGKSDFDLFTEEHAQQAFKDEQTVIETGKPLNLEEKETRENRADRWVSTVKVPLYDNDRKIIGTFGISRDITEEKKIKEQLFFLAYAFKSISECVSVTDMDDNIIFLNQAFLETYGFEENELMGKSISIIRSPNNKPEIVEEILPSTKKGSWRGELLNLRKDRSEFPVYVVTSVIRNDQSEPIALIGIATDITLRKKEEENINGMNEKLKIINAEKDKFFSILAHDLRGPLSAFVGATQILTEDSSSMDMEDVREISKEMKSSASNIYNLLENLLEWSRLMQGRMDFVPEKVNLKKKIEECTAVSRESALNKRIGINIAIPENISVVVDNHMFDTIIRNLVSNAIKFTPVDGTVILSVKEVSDKEIMINITDSGIGIPQNLIGKLFSLTEKTNRNGTEGEPSTGLGLLLCKEFVEKHGGKITVESVEGKGTTFSFTISK